MSFNCRVLCFQKLFDLFWLLLSVQCGSAIPEEGSSCIQWEDCKEKIDLVALASKEPILFYDEVGGSGLSDFWVM